MSFLLMNDSKVRVIVTVDNIVRLLDDIDVYLMLSDNITSFKMMLAVILIDIKEYNIVYSTMSFYS